jgi:hypothetical protein
VQEEKSCDFYENILHTCMAHHGWAVGLVIASKHFVTSQAFFFGKSVRKMMNIYIAFEARILVESSRACFV